MWLIMNKSELKEFLEEVDSLIDSELPVFFNNSPLKSKFSSLIELSVWGDDSLDDEVMKRLDVLTDNMDSFDFGLVKNNIHDLEDLL